MATEVEAGLREAFQRLAELERRLKQLEGLVGTIQAIAVQIKPGGY